MISKYNSERIKSMLKDQTAVVLGARVDAQMAMEQEHKSQ